MRRLIAAVLVMTVLLAMTPAPVQAGTAGKVALGLAAFAVFNQLVGYPRPVYATPVVVGAPVVVHQPVYLHPNAYYVYPSSYVYVQAPVPTVVQYPHGRYELRGDGVYTAYQWVWVPNPPPPPPPQAPPAPPSSAPPPQR